MSTSEVLGERSDVSVVEDEGISNVVSRSSDALGVSVVDWTMPVVVSSTFEATGLGVVVVVNRKATIGLAVVDGAGLLVVSDSS